MIIQSKFKKCSICLKQKPLTWEHIIPESLGGTLESDIQCSICNSKLGSELISCAKKNYPIRLAINSLKKELPELYNSIENWQQYTGIDSIGQLSKIELKKGKLKTKAEKKEDGSIILDQSYAEKNISNMLSKNGIEPLQIEKSLIEYDNSPINTLVKLSNNVYAMKIKYKEMYQTPREVFMDERIIVLIIYNYFCLIFGDLIFDKRLNFIRDFIKDNISSEKIIVNQYPYTEEYKPYHEIFYITDDVSIKVTMIFFGSIVYEVIFFGITTLKNNMILIEDLKNKRILLSQTFEDAEKGNYYTNKQI